MRSIPTRIQHHERAVVSRSCNRIATTRPRRKRGKSNAHDGHPFHGRDAIHRQQRGTNVVEAGEACSHHTQHPTTHNNTAIEDVALTAILPTTTHGRLASHGRLARPPLPVCRGLGCVRALSSSRVPSVMQCPRFDKSGCATSTRTPQHTSAARETPQWRGKRSWGESPERSAKQTVWRQRSRLAHWPLSGPLSVLPTQT